MANLERSGIRNDQFMTDFPHYYEASSMKNLMRTESMIPDLQKDLYQKMCMQNMLTAHYNLARPGGFDGAIDCQRKFWKNVEVVRQLVGRR